MSVLIDPVELQTLMSTEPAVVIDIRDPAANAREHLPGAVNLRDIFSYLATTDPDGIGELQAKFAAAFGAAGLAGSGLASSTEAATPPPATFPADTPVCTLSCSRR